MNPLAYLSQQIHKPYITHLELANHLNHKSAHSRYGLIKRAQAKGHIQQLRRGLYTLGDGTNIHPFVFAYPIYPPACISLESALSYHGLIPEAVYTITSVTPRRSQSFKTPYGTYTYNKVPQRYFYLGVDRICENNQIFLMAQPWRAICDYVYCYKKDWKNSNPLIDSLRIEREDLPPLDNTTASALVNFYHTQRMNIFIQAMLKEFSS